MPTARFDALVAIAWSRVWSPVVPPPLFVAAWRALDLPEDHAMRDTLFFSTFHAGFPSPQVPLLLHVALNRPGDSARMDFLRAMSHLGIKAGNHMLPPDHLAVACEVAASALAADEPVIVDQIRERYLRPWCDVTVSRLAAEDPGLLGIVLDFQSFVLGLGEAGALASAPTQDVADNFERLPHPSEETESLGSSAGRTASRRSGDIWTDAK
jgi:hypothetical protein